jgi:hypothetical protein
MSELSSKDLAMQALQKIAEHEEECGKRWMEAHKPKAHLGNIA